MVFDEVQGLEMTLTSIEKALKIIKQLGPDSHLAKVDLCKGYLQFPIYPGNT